MYFFILVISCVVVLSTLLRYISYRNWSLVYTAFGYEEYFKIKAKLDQYGLKTKTRSPLDLGNSNRGIPMKDMKQYDIYVKKGEEGLVGKALRNQ